MPLAPAERDKLLAKVKSLTVDVSIGFAHGYFFISVGDNNEHIENFGQGEGLATTDKLQRLGPHAGERITDISYVSKELLASARDTKEDVRELASLAEEWLPLAELDEEVEKRILSDVKELTNDLAEYVTEPGAVVSCNYLSDRGVEGYTYNWNENLLLDPSRKLPILSHLGGSPLMAFVTRTKYSPEHYELLVKWLKKGHTYVEQFLVEELSPSEQAQYQTIWARVLPLLRRLDTATGEMLLPSLADGQTALVIDSRLRTDQWIAMLPRTKDPMPVLEPALLMGVSDAELLKKAMSEYRAIVNQGIKLASELSGGQVPPLELPPPEKRSFDEGDIYFYRFPEMVGLYKKLAINGGLNDEVAVVSLVPLQTKRLLGDTPLDVTGPLSRAQDQHTSPQWAPVRH